MICKFCGKGYSIGNKIIHNRVAMLIDSLEGDCNAEPKKLIAAFELLIHADLGNHIKYDNFYLKTTGTFTECAKPNRVPDYISNKNTTPSNSQPSNYWYGVDDIGEYVVRMSDHWCNYYVNNSILINQKKKIVDCKWHFQFEKYCDSNILRITNKEYITGKIYLLDLSKIQ